MLAPWGRELLVLQAVGIEPIGKSSIHEHERKTEL